MSYDDKNYLKLMMILVRSISFNSDISRKILLKAFKICLLFVFINTLRNAFPNHLTAPPLIVGLESDCFGSKVSKSLNITFCCGDSENLMWTLFP